MKTIILANGIIENYSAIKKYLTDASYIIACDGGIRHAHAMGIIPHIIIGDMDSVPPELLMQAEKQNVKIITHPAMKDETDLELAITHAYENGATQIKILGATGGRIDHQLANLHLLAMHPEITEICDEKTSIKLIASQLTVQKGEYETISLIPLTTEVTGITTTGLFYPLHGEALKVGFSRGVSNCFCADSATISIESGLLLAIRAK